MLRWTDDNRFVLDGTAFHAMPPGMLSVGADVELRDDEFFVFKSRDDVERYVALFAEAAPRRVFELGIYGGGSTLLFGKLVQPGRVVAIDRLALRDNLAKLRRYTEAHGLSDVVRPFGEVDQADRARLAELVETELGGGPLDLVVDDCSHLYEPSLASFNELFPRLRPGGAYVIEDWRWAHTPVGDDQPEGLLTDQVPLTRLLFEIALAIPGRPGLVSDLSIEADYAVVRRGDLDVEAAEFDVAACSNPRGRALLAEAP
jgi:predicted O-methyltransferase YrrM